LFARKSTPGAITTPLTEGVSGGGGH